jgi:hypothetical protein
MMISTEKILTEDQGQSKESERAKSKQSITEVTYLSLSHTQYLAEVHLSPESSGSAHWGTGKFLDSKFGCRGLFYFIMWDMPKQL